MSFKIAKLLKSWSLNPLKSPSYPMYMDWDEVQGVYSCPWRRGWSHVTVLMTLMTPLWFPVINNPVYPSPRLAPTLSDNIPRTFWSNHTSLNPSLMGNPYQDSNSFALQTRVHVSSGSSGDLVMVCYQNQELYQWWMWFILMRSELFPQPSHQWLVKVHTHTQPAQISLF